MRSAVAMLALCALSGCGSHDTSASYTLYVDDAQIADVNHDGQPWCAAAALPLVSVVATLPPFVAETSEQLGLSPSWREPLVDAEVSTYRTGLSLDVRGRCDGATFFMGRALLHPDAAMVQGGGVALGPLGNVTRLRLHFARGVTGASSASDGTDPSFGYGDGDYGWYAPDPTATDPGDDWSDGSDDPSAGDPGDDGSGGDCCSDGSGDPGGDSGGDTGDDSGDARRPQPRGGARAARAGKTRYLVNIIESSIVPSSR